jgi:penicillin-binding protein 2
MLLRPARVLIPMLLIGLAVACTPRPDAAQPLPTLMPTPTQAVDLIAAERVAREFLDAWQAADFEAMYEQISFASQGVITREDFAAFYSRIHDQLTLDSLAYEAHTLARDAANPVAAFYYDMEFESRILGQIRDEGRILSLVIDPASSTWRVAWSPGDVFYEMGNGARLVFAPSVPSRANIYDRRGQVLANQEGVIVGVQVVEEAIPEPAACRALLADVLEKSPEDLQAIFDRSGANWLVEVGYVDPPGYASHVDALEALCGATFRRQSTRQYLNGELMPHILGHVGLPDPSEVDDLVRQGFNAETILGKSGIEASWDTTLRGQPGGRLQVVAASGAVLRTLAEVPARPPQSLWLTIDSRLQQFLMKTLGEAYANAAATWAPNSRGASAIVMEVRTGEILGMASWPSFDGNALTAFPAIGEAAAEAELRSLADDPAVPQLFRPTQGSYPTGSTMKVVDALAALDSGVFDERTQYYCNGTWQQGNDRRYDWLAGGHGRMTVSSALTNSCNPFFYEVGFRLNAVDPELLPAYMRRFGLGAPTEIGAVPEAPGFVPDPEWVYQRTGYPWNFSEAVTIAIGQGFLEATPLQMARIYAAVANGGDLMRPQLVHEVGILDQRTFVAAPEVTAGLHVSDETLRIVQEGLCGVTSRPTGTATHIFRDSPLLDIGVCGKTGTAQAGGVGQPPHSWFTAYAPADDPEIVVLVMIENAGEGSAVAAPLTRQILEYYFFSQPE